MWHYKELYDFKNDKLLLFTVKAFSYLEFVFVYCEIRKIISSHLQVYNQLYECYSLTISLDPELVMPPPLPIWAKIPAHMWEARCGCPRGYHPKLWGVETRDHWGLQAISLAPGQWETLSQGNKVKSHRAGHLVLLEPLWVCAKVYASAHMYIYFIYTYTKLTHVHTLYFKGWLLFITKSTVCV